MEVIQFIAHHDLQAQVFMGILPYLNEHKVSVTVGQNVQINEAATIVVVADHLAFQNQIKPASKAKYVHLSHDISDLEIYLEDLESLRFFDLILCPTLSHFNSCKFLLPKVPAFPVGWHKNSFDKTEFDLTPEFQSELPVIIFAPTEIADLDWKKFINRFVLSNYQVFVKNHIYWNFEYGLAPPSGQEERYYAHKDAVLEMEAYITTQNFKNIKLVDRRSNIKSLFLQADYLITDSSSAALEFINYGKAIEFGIFEENKLTRVPSVSSVDGRVVFIDESELLKSIGENQLNETYGVNSENREISTEVDFFQNFSSSADEISAYLIQHSLKRTDIRNIRQIWQREHVKLFLLLKSQLRRLPTLPR